MNLYDAAKLTLWHNYNMSKKIKKNVNDFYRNV